MNDKKMILNTNNKIQTIKNKYVLHVWPMIKTLFFVKISCVLMIMVLEYNIV
jgi:hypothetical protein